MRITKELFKKSYDRYRTKDGDGLPDYVIDGMWLGLRKMTCINCDKQNSEHAAIYMPKDITEFGPSPDNERFRLIWYRVCTKCKSSLSLNDVEQLVTTKVKRDSADQK